MKLSQTAVTTASGKRKRIGVSKVSTIVDGEDDIEAQVHEERVKEALTKGVLASSKASSHESDDEVVDAYTGMIISKHILKSDGKDIIKKGSRARRKYLLVFRGWLDLVKAGKLGTLQDLDTQNPSLCIDFPKLGGSLKMLGTIVFPSTKYAILNFEHKKQIIIDEIFDSMVVFSKACWVLWSEDVDGDAEERKKNGQVLDSIPNDVIHKLVKADDDGNRNLGNDVKVEENEGGQREEEGNALPSVADKSSFRCGATTGEPTVIRVKRKKKEQLSVFDAFNMSDATHQQQILKPFGEGDLEEMEIDSDDLQSESEDDDMDSDDSYKISASQRAKKNKNSSGAKNALSTTRRKKQPARKKPSHGATKVDPKLKKEVQEDTDVVEVVSDDSGDEDEESDWSGMD